MKICCEPQPLTLRNLAEERVVTDRDGKTPHNLGTCARIAIVTKKIYMNVQAAIVHPTFRFDNDFDCHEKLLITCERRA